MIRLTVESEGRKKQKANAVNQHSEASDKKLSQPSTHHETATATKAAELFNTNRRSVKLPIPPDDLLPISGGMFRLRCSGQFFVR
jgi:hypothetical protein